jgi:hypothetical protein
MTENLKPIRWLATVTYRTDSGPTEVDHAFQELGELADIIEAGPNWFAIVKIEILLQDKTLLPGLTVEGAEKL